MIEIDLEKRLMSFMSLIQVSLPLIHISTFWLNFPPEAIILTITQIHHAHHECIINLPYMLMYTLLSFFFFCSVAFTFLPH